MTRFLWRALRRVLPLLGRGEEPPPYEPLRRIVDAYDREDGADRALYFGDSVVERVSQDDADPTTLGEMVAERLANATVVSFSAFRPQMYLSLARVLELTRTRPPLVILPVNIRCFSPQWDWNPAFDLAREVAAVEAYCQNPQAGVPRLTPTSQLRRGYWRKRVFRRRPVRYPIGDFRRVGDFLDVIARRPSEPAAVEERWRQIFTFHYLHPLDPDHRQLRALGRLLDLLAGLGVHVVGYLTPVNHQAGARLLGDAFGTAVSATVGTVLGQVADAEGRSRATGGAGATWADWSFLLGEDGFFHRNEPTEHLNERGRRVLADAVARLVVHG